MVAVAALGIALLFSAVATPINLRSVIVMDEMNLSGLIPILGGIYGFLMAVGAIPRQPKEPEKMELWRRKYGGMMKVICPLIVIHGFLKLFRIL